MSKTCERSVEMGDTFLIEKIREFWASFVEISICEFCEEYEIALAMRFVMTLLRWNLSAEMVQVDRLKARVKPFSCASGVSCSIDEVITSLRLKLSGLRISLSLFSL